MAPGNYPLNYPHVISKQKFMPKSQELFVGKSPLFLFNLVHNFHQALYLYTLSIQIKIYVTMPLHLTFESCNWQKCIVFWAKKFAIYAAKFLDLLILSLLHFSREANTHWHPLSHRRRHTKLWNRKTNYRTINVCIPNNHFVISGQKQPTRLKKQEATTTTTYHQGEPNTIFVLKSDEQKMFIASAAAAVVEWNRLSL